MFRPEKQSLDQLNAWPICESGLSARIVNCARTTKLDTVQHLRNLSDEQLRAIKNFGPKSRRELRQFLGLMDSIAAGSCFFTSIRDVFDLFLDDDQLFVLSHRYGFDEKIDRISRKRMTLQQIANQSGRTRERIRQIEREALAALSSRGARICLQPFYHFFADLLHDRLQGSAGLSELLDTADTKACGGYHPASLMLLLYDLYAGHFTLFDGFFSTLSIKQLEQLKHTGMNILRESTTPMTPLQITTRFDSLPEGISQQRALKAVDLLMQSAPSIVTSRDHLHFDFETTGVAFIVSLLPLPAHYREMTRIFNEHVIPDSRRGSGTILRLLNTNSQLCAEGNGIYRLHGTNL